MKKLIMCVVAVMSACALNAATVSWTVGSLFDENFDSLVGVVTVASGSYSDTADIISAGASGQFDGVTLGTDPFNTGAAWTVTAKVQDGNGDWYEKVFNATLGSIDPSDERTAATAFAALGSSAETALVPDGFLDTSDLASAGWTKTGGGGVPEPTSGLLLLVGGAMLALRRKRA